MNRFAAIITSLAALSVLVSPSCKKAVDTPQAGPQVTIRACVPDDATKVALTPSGDGLHLAWEAGDALRVISGSQSEQFAIKDGFTDHEASFTGTAVSGTSFDIIYPGTFASVSEAEASDFSYQEQDGNGSTAHLRYAALLSGVDDYTDIAFTQEWASAHGGAIKRAGAIKMDLTLPAGVTTVTGVDVDLAGRALALGLKNVDVSQSAQVLTAYLMTPWEDMELAAGSKVEIKVTASDDACYGISFSLAEARSLKAGHVSVFKVPNNIEEYRFAGGSGTEADPWLIANARQLRNMMTLYADAEAPADKNSFKKWFRLTKDIDASSISSWTPLNNSGSFYKAIDFDGDSHVISGLKLSGTYASFTGVLYGTLRNLTLDGATVSGSGTKCGVVAGFLGTDGLPGYCENVVVSNSTVTSTSYAGGFAGQVRNTGSVTGCSVVNTTVTTTGYAGGFTAYADLGSGDKYQVPCIFTDCHVTDVTVNQNYATDAAWYTGGFVGCAAQSSSFKNCTVKATINANKAAIQDVGGFIGRDTYAGANFNGCQVLEGTVINAKGAHAGGFIGYSESSASFIDCSSAASVTNTAEYTGGFAGMATGASAFTRCNVTGNVSGYLYVGGFAGMAENASFIDCSYSQGTVSGSGTTKYTLTAGFCGYATTGLAFRGCEVRGAVVKTDKGQRIGGFVGQLGSSYTSLNNISLAGCNVSDAQVTGGTNTGGFVGVQYDNISRCYVSGGSVTAKNAHCGGFAGFAQQGSATNCYTTAEVIGGSQSQVGGFVGIQYSSNISYCYSAGAISGGGSDMGAFTGQCALQGTPGSIDHCIGWHASLPFFGYNPAEATITECYAGNSESVSAQATMQAWPTTVWDLSGSLPQLLASSGSIPAIFVGDSITWQWARNSNTFAQSSLLIPFNSAYMTQSGSNVTVKFHPGFFSGHGYLDKGVSGQNTTQMLSRFEKDVVVLGPRVVVIMGGTNDLAQGVSEEGIRDNLAAMAQLATAAGIKVVLCSVTPCNNSSSRLKNPNTKGVHIIALNGLIKSLCESSGYTYCNYWDAMVDTDGLSLHPDYRLYDYLHPGPDGYDVMEGILQPILEGLLN